MERRFAARRAQLLADALSEADTDSDVENRCVM
jgi:hypothetical protein